MAQDSAFSTLISGYTFFESPRWREGRLWLSDFYTGQVLAVGMDGQAERIAEVARQPSGLGWLPDGRLLVVSMLDRKLLRREADGALVMHADLAGVATGPANDMVVDARGRAWVGNFGFDLMGGAPPRPTRLARVDPDGRVGPVGEELMFPNGIVLTPDGATLVVAETFGNRLSAFDILPNGDLGPRRDWARFGPLPGAGDAPGAQPRVAPDGTALDADGAIWAADALGHRVLRVAEGGRVLQEISTGDQGVYACALGGPGGTTLFLCVAPDHDAHKRSAAREAAIWTVPVEVPGAVAA
ncbi:MAG: SMP-30/gluconolactonase/LRE family protein [Variovorax sp.]